MNLNNVNVQEDLEDVAMDVATKPALSPKAKAIILVGAAVLTAGVAVAGYFGYKGLKARRAAKLAQTSSETTEQHE